MTDEKLDQILKQALAPEIGEHEITVNGKAREEAMKKENANRRMRRYRVAAVVAASMALTVGVFQIPQVNATANMFLQKIMYQFTTKDNKKVDLCMTENTDLKNAPTKDLKYDTLQDAGKALHVDFLTSSASCTTGKKHISYTPILNDKGDIDSIEISDDLYAIGDLKHPNVMTFKDTSTLNMIEYNNGDTYKSPIGMQIAIAVSSDAIKNPRTGVTHGASWNASMDKNCKNSTVYKMKAGPKAFIETTKGKAEDGLGPEVWQNRDGRITELTSAVFTYHGVEYSYFGAVSVHTMEEFLDTLR